MSTQSSKELQSRQVAAALKRLESMQKQEDFDPTRPGSRPTPAQQEIINDFGKIPIQWIVASNRCKPETSLVAMADGTHKRMGDIVEGDKVLAWDNEKQAPVASSVIKKWNNGIKEVHRYWYKKNRYTDSTPNHKMVYHNGKNFIKKEIAEIDHVLLASGIVEGNLIDAPVNGPELLGYLLGDGSFSKLADKGLRFTNTNSEIVAYVQELLDPTEYRLRKTSEGDDFYIRPPEDRRGKGKNIFINWIRDLGLEGKKAKDKFIPEVIFKAPIEVRYKFIAGLIATDGCISNDGNVNFYTTSKQLADGLIQLYQGIGIISTLSKRTSQSVSHSQAYMVEIKQARFRTKFHKNIKVPGKPFTGDVKGIRKYPDKLWQESYIRRTEVLGEMETYDITIDHPDHTYICDGLLTSNSGKTALASRTITWMITDTHPSWTKPEAWGDTPLVTVVAARTGKQIENVIIPKILSYLVPGTYKLMKLGNVVQHLEILSNGNRIIFQSLENANSARERLQGYTAHLVWIDEQPPLMSIVAEMLMRIQTDNGYFLATFTPLVFDVDLQKMVDSAALPHSKKYQLMMLDNPMLSDKDQKEKVLKALEGLSEDERNARLYGTWVTAEGLVYHFDPVTMLRDIPETYSNTWRHVESVDPALKSALGLTIWAEDPNSGQWYCIHSECIEKISIPSMLIREVQKRTQGKNIVRRIADSHESWYIGTAQEMGLTYIPVYKKTNRKRELMKNAQEMLGKKVFLTLSSQGLIQELKECRWSSKAEEKIVNSQSWHCIDSWHYFCDNIPKYDPLDKVQFSMEGYHNWIYQENEKRKVQEHNMKSRNLRLLKRRGVRWK